MPRGYRWDVESIFHRLNASEADLWCFYVISKVRLACLPINIGMWLRERAVKEEEERGRQKRDGKRAKKGKRSKKKQPKMEEIPSGRGS